MTFSADYQPDNNKLKKCQHKLSLDFFFIICLLERRIITWLTHIHTHTKDVVVVIVVVGEHTQFPRHTRIDNNNILLLLYDQSKWNYS